MNLMKQMFQAPRIGYAVLAVAFGLVAWAAMPSSASARVFVGIGLPFPGFAPYPYYPYAYAPPPPYYPPPAAYYPPPAAAAPAAAPAAAASPSITYTERPAFKNSSGNTCREVHFASGTTGTACQDPGGQWRIAQ
jgi:hypothetical protein